MLSDHETILAVEYNKDKNSIIKKENLRNANESIISYKESGKYVHTLSLDKVNNTFLAGDWNGYLLKYNISTGAVIKDYGYIGIGKIYCSTRLNNLCFFWRIC